MNSTLSKFNLKRVYFLGSKANMKRKTSQSLRRIHSDRMLACLVVFIFGGLHGMAQPPCKSPLSEAQISQLVRQGIADGSIQSQVEACGLSFNPSQPALERLKQAKANAIVLISIRRKGEAQQWEFLRRGATPQQLEEFLKDYPQTQHAGEARAIQEALSNPTIVEERVRLAIKEADWPLAEAMFQQLDTLLRNQLTTRPDMLTLQEQIVQGKADAELLRQATEAARQAAEAERMRIAKEEQEQKLRTEAARLDVLRRSIGLQAIPPLPGILTLAEARRRLGALKSTIRDIGIRLHTQYRPLNEPPEVPKGTFETTAEYKDRIAASSAKKAEAEKQYGLDLASLIAPYQEQISTLLERDYVAERNRQAVTLASYDADRQVLFAALGGWVYRFSVARDQARQIFADAKALQISGPFLQAEEAGQSAPTRLDLIHSASGANLKSDWAGLDITGDWSAQAFLGGGCLASRGKEHYVNLKLSVRLTGDTLTGTLSEKCGVLPGRSAEIIGANVTGASFVFKASLETSGSKPTLKDFTGHASAKELAISVEDRRFTMTK